MEYSLKLYLTPNEIKQKNAIDRNTLSVKDEQVQIKYDTIRGATLIHGHNPCAYQETNISPATDVCRNVAEYSVKGSHLTAPSAVHLTTCFLPDFQLRRLSVKASLPLSPSQRFKIFIFCIISPLYSSVKRLRKICSFFVYAP